MLAAATLALAFLAPASRAASTTTADGVVVVPIPAGWRLAPPQAQEQLRLEGPNGFLSVRRPQGNRVLMTRRSDELAQMFVKRDPSCSPGSLASDTMPNGVELVYHEVSCPRAKSPQYYLGAFSFGDYVYTARWHVEVSNPYKYGVGVISLLRTAETGPVTGWIKSWEGDVMVPMPAGEWQDFTDTMRGQDPTVVAHITAGANDITLNREPSSDPAGLAALAEGEAEERTAALGHCVRSGAGQISLSNGWKLQGVAMTCQGPQGGGTYSFGAFDAKGKGAYSVFGLYDKKVLDSTIGSASLASEAKEEGKPVEIAVPTYKPPAYVGVIVVAAIPTILCLLYFFRKRKPELPEEEVEAEAEDEQPPAQPPAPPPQA